MKRTAETTPERSLLLRLVDEGYDKKAWHGTNLRGALRRVSATQAVWRPAPRRHNIAEITVHCAYWKYAVRRRIRGDKRGSFALKGNNWFAVSSRLSDDGWRETLRLLEDEHRELRDAVATCAWSRLADGPGGGGRSPADHVHGAALHDVYHAGQIQTLKALHKGR
ncbi:MAG: DinB family protein [Phycisphaerae bacterium]